MTYEIDIAGLKRELPICKVTDDLYIGAFVIFGDPEITVHAAEKLLERIGEFDYLVAPEAKAIPLCYEMSRQSGKKYFIVRKGVKAYMQEPFKVEVNSITTRHVQTLVLDRADADAISGKRVVIVDDVISTGESLRAVEVLCGKVNAEVVARVAVLAEGDAFDREDLTVLQKLPLFNADGSVKA